MSAIIVPERFETESVRKGRAMSIRLLEELRELKRRGKFPARVRITRQAADTLVAYFAWATDGFDGVLPKRIAGCDVVVEPGAGYRLWVDVWHQDERASRPGIVRHSETEWQFTEDGPEVQH